MLQLIRIVVTFLGMPNANRNWARIVAKRIGKSRSNIRAFLSIEAALPLETESISEEDPLDAFMR